MTIDEERGLAAKKFVDRLKEIGFFDQFCTMVCPEAENGNCVKYSGLCPYGDEEIMSFWIKAAKSEELNCDDWLINKKHGGYKNEKLKYSKWLAMVSLCTLLISCGGNTSSIEISSDNVPDGWDSELYGIAVKTYDTLNDYESGELSLAEANNQITSISSVLDNMDSDDFDGLNFANYQYIYTCSEFAYNTLTSQELSADGKITNIEPM